MQTSKIPQSHFAVILPGGFFFMAAPIVSGFLPICRKGSAPFLAFSFLSGLLAGIGLFLQTDPSFLPLMHGISSGSASIVTRAFILLIRLVISWLFACVDPAFLFPICFVRAFLFAFVQMTFLGFWSSSGWLICPVLLFCDWASLPVLYFFWHRWLRYPVSRPVSLAIPFCLLCCVVWIDVCMVSPLGEALLILMKG